MQSLHNIVKWILWRNKELKDHRRMTHAISASTRLFIGFNQTMIRQQYNAGKATKMTLLRGFI